MGNPALKAVAYGVISLPGGSNGGCPDFLRNQFMPSKTLGRETSLRSRVYFPGKLVREMPMRILRIPCPGSSNMAMPAMINTTPSRFLKTSPIQ